ncbi:cupin domain-containing protein [Ectobacillus ponti]|uniref:Cupin domain-containing protein n=1 Tax=Ectobacillus ponti TaxID=2961894 RepID=A0AA42BRG4_9BACI|nr:cupin domain-containing protein [Ectobacillus ponti]MCP8967363.1 cupin domain-containing protein [Ectobacillus ponti]
MEQKQLTQFPLVDKVIKVPLFRTGQATAVLVRLDKDGVVAEHSHPGHDVFLHVTAGTVALTIDGSEHTAGPDQFLHLDGNERIRLENKEAERAAVYIVLCKQK